MKKVILTKGLPASGKTTWAKQILNENPGMYKRINKDDLRAMLDDSKWSKSNESFIIKVRDSLILSALEDGKHVIIDDTNLSSKHEARISQLIKGKAILEIQDFTQVPLEACIERDSKRSNPVGSKVILDMFNQFLRQRYEPPKDKPKAYIFDIDGTLAKMKDRSPFDWHRVGEDDLNIPVFLQYKALKKDHKIILFSGRDSVCEPDTRRWLCDNGIDFDLLLMRPKDNNEKDTIIKRAMFDQIKNDYEIMAVFDDRDQVVAMWRSLGLTCFQVDYGIF